MADQTYNSDTVKNGNPYKKKSHSYDVVELMHATTFERTVDDLGQTQWIFSDGGRTSLHPRIHQKYDYNMALKLPDEIRNAAPQHRQECAIDLFYEWKRPIGKQTQDTLKVTDLQIHKDYQPGPIAQRLLDERAERHPELFDSAGNPSQEEPFHAEPLTNPNPPSAEQRAEMLRTAQESMARISEDAKTPDTSAIATTSIAPPADADNSITKTEGSELDKVFGKREKRPVVNPDNWTHNVSKLNGFYAELQAKCWNKYGIPGPEKSKHIHAALGVNSLHETNLSPDVALVAVLVYLDKLFGKKDDNVTAPETTEITKDQWQAWLNDHNWNKKPFVLIALNAYSIEHGEGPVTKLGEWGFELDIATDAVNAFLDDIASREEKATPQGESEAQGTSEPPKQEAPAQPPKSSTGNPFKPASFDASKLRMALVGPSGSGKTFTALKIATNLLPNARVALIDTERGSASKYAKLFKFDVLELRQYHPDFYVKAIKAAVDNNYDVLVIDSLTHAWNGDGGILSIVDKKGGGFDKWKDVNPILWKMVDAILDSPIHIIATMRTKTDYVMEVNERTGKTMPRKVGLAPIQKDGIEYEFDVYGEIDLASTMSITKSRCPELTATEYPKAGSEVAAILGKWLSAA